MKLARFLRRDDSPGFGLVTDRQSVRDLSDRWRGGFTALLELNDPVGTLGALGPDQWPEQPLGELRLLPPVEQQEVWAAGVTYLRSKAARMDESDFGATAYDRVYAADRPELFFKSMPGKVVGPGGAVGIRRDAGWNVPEPELALVLNSRGRVVGYTIGNDMSSRDIEGENLLYLPQAKIYHSSCALGPWIVLDADETIARQWSITLTIRREGETAFQGATDVARIRRAFDDLAHYLFRSQQFPFGAVLLTGTGIVPPHEFTLHPGDVVTIGISGIGTLENPVVAV